MIVLADIDAMGGEETKKMITEAGGQAIFVSTDVTKACQVNAMVEQTLETYGRLDCAFNNAGIAWGGPIVACPEETWDRVIDINLKGVWLSMKYEIPPMLAQGRGAIVNMASIRGLVGSPNASAYVASKHGVIGLTKAIALEYAKRGVRVNAVCPGFIRTPLTETGLSDPVMGPPIVAAHPLGRVGTPAEVAEAVVWLCSDAASFVTGHALTVDGGYVAQ